MAGCFSCLTGIKHWIHNNCQGQVTLYMTTLEPGTLCVRVPSNIRPVLQFLNMIYKCYALKMFRWKYDKNASDAIYFLTTKENRSVPLLQHVLWK